MVLQDLQLELFKIREISSIPDGWGLDFSKSKSRGIPVKMRFHRLLLVKSLNNLISRLKLALTDWHDVLGGFCLSP